MNLFAPDGYSLDMTAGGASTAVGGGLTMGLPRGSGARRCEHGGTALAGEWQREDPATDESLLVRIADGQRDALAALYERHRQPLFGFLVRMLGDSTRAEEALQDTLVAVWRGAASYRGEASVRAWLFGIARRQAYSRLRRRSLELVPLDAIATPADDRPSPEDEALRRGDARQMRRALAQLTPAHREVLTLFFLDDFAQAEISAVLGVPVGTVKSRLNHAKKALGAELRATWGDGDD